MFSMSLPQTLYKLKVHPASRKDMIIRKGVDSFELWVRAPAERGQANTAALSLLALSLKLPVKRLRIVKGSQSLSKIVSVLG